MRDAIQTIQLYYGKGSRQRSFWRQRAHIFDYEIISPDLVEVIGSAIQFQEDIESI